MSEMKSRTYSGPAGEYLVLGELLRRNYEAYLAHGETQKGWDIVLLSKSGAFRRIQVKTIDWPNELAVNGRFDSGFDVLIVVLLNCSGRPRYLIIPQSQLEPLISPFNPARKNKQRTLTVSKNFMTDKVRGLSVFEDGWSIFDDKMA